MIQIIPNIVTSLNLVLGMLAIISALRGELAQSAILIVAAMLADMSDGRVARYFRVSSDFGKELDSLCDLVSFGAAPAILAYVFMLKDYGFIGAAVAIIFALCGALRLARFNVNTSNVKGYFMGLPIPGGGCVLATYVMTDVHLALPWIFPLLVLIFAYLMVSTVKYPDFKGKGEKLRTVPAIISIGTSIYILCIVPNSYLFTAFFSYTLFGIFNTIFGLFDRPLEAKGN